ncbi:hypothetical protein BB561_004628 [Smittium simulii]|uniref:PXA domain-containing protein n=1 Tax=Smittium simulii TaxID=133385 RepID=A0A2T9YF52_9FUNG|nr:hypothetical protein BB561_004628 [Smittium simulii]
MPSFNKVRLCSTDPIYSIRPELNQEITALVQLIIKKLVNKWFDRISPNTQWQQEIKKNIATVSLEVEKRLNAIEWNKYILFDLTQIIVIHLKEVHQSYSRLETVYAGNCNTIEELFQKRNQHCALLSAADSELLYLRALTKEILLIILPKETSEDDVCVCLFKEIIGNMVLRQLIDKISDPSTFYELLITVSL